MITVHKLTLRWSNAWLLVSGTHAVLIDTGYPGETERIRTLCRSRNVDPNRLTLIVHTHVHVDHFGCTAELAKAAGCPITFHPADQHLADQKTPLKLTPATFSGRLLAPLFINKTFRNHPCDFPALAGLRLDSFGIPATIHQTPGHTAGSISVVLDDGRAIIGDLLMGGYAGGWLWSHKPRLHYFAEDLPQILTSLDHLLAITSGPLFPGHGGPLQHSDVVRWRANQGR